MVRLALVAALLATLCAVVSAQQSYQGEACPWYQIYPAYFNATAFLVRSDSCAVMVLTSTIAPLPILLLPAVQERGVLQGYLL